VIRARAILTRCLPATLLLLIAGLDARAATPVTCAPQPASRPQPTEYFVSLADNAKHLAHVSIRLPGGAGTRVLNMPVWNALYQVRNFAANIENVRAQDTSGAAANVTLTGTSQWEIAAPPGCLVVSYDIHLDSPGPFGSALDAHHAFFNWAMVLMYSPALRSQPDSIRLLDVPPTWQLRDLHVLGAAGPGRISDVIGVAHNYDELADSPAELGDFQQSQFQQDGATYHVVVDGNPADYDMARIDQVLGEITHSAVDWMQDRPYDEYTFLYHFPRGPAGGGMEHAYGTAIDMNAERLRDNPVGLASVSAHEFFHLWNVKRIRPQSLEPVDYQREMNTRALWFSEGVTNTVADLLMARAGLIDEQEYLRRQSAEITELLGRPAHQWQSAEESSLDAWLEGTPFYRTPERSISYYNKGAILGVLLDLRMRQLTGGRKSLRDLFQWMDQHYARQGRYFPDSAGVQEAAETITRQSFTNFFRDYVAGVMEIPFDDFLRFVGLHLGTRSLTFSSAGFTTTANIGGVPEVTNVEPNSDARRLGITVGDRITVIDGRPAQASLNEDIANMPPGTVVRLRVENRRAQRDVELTLGAHTETKYEILELPTVTPQQRAHRTAWIHGDDEPGIAP
jgi:predicted metalloprotease with PDZ domain